MSNNSESGSGCALLIGTVIALSLLYRTAAYAMENAKSIALWLGPLALVMGTWHGLRAIHYMLAKHPAADAVKRRSLTRAARFLCTIDRGGLSFMHRNQAMNAIKLSQEVEKENLQIHREIASLEAELKRLGDVHAGSAAQAIAAVQSSRYDADLRRALIRRLAEEEGMHVSR